MSKRLILVTCALIMGCSHGLAYDLIIKNARIIDGTGAPWFRGDVAITSRTVAAVGVLEEGSTAPRVIEAADRYVAPGFIDVHTHCEDDLLTMPAAENFVRMGVTSIISGNCGSSYTNLAEAFTSHTAKGIGINFASLLGQGTIRRKVVGNVRREATTTEVAAMQEIIERGMRAGAVGMSTGLIYTPGTYTKTEEIAELAKAVGKYHGVYASHMRSEGTNITEAINEALSIGKAGNCPVEISHFKITSPRRFGQSTHTVQMVEDARAAGQDVTVDQYVYTASSTGISTMLPDWANEGTSEAVKARLTDPTSRALILKSIIEERKSSGRPNMDYAHVTSFRPDPTINGKSLLEIAKKWKDSDSWEAQAAVVVDIVTSGGSGMVFHSMDEKDVQNIAQYHNSMFASDSGVREFGNGVPHPRGYGNNARVLARYVRDIKLLRLEDAIRKMTSLPARTFRFMDRGILRPGMAADLVVFDLERVNDPATFEDPHHYAEGFDWVLVNGEPVIADGKLTGARSGQILRGPGYRAEAEAHELDEAQKEKQ
ncbi:MAG: N-acyl-D-amino-acid deacylase family protein [Candidatus Sumerlaeaceae bacterium]